MGTDIIIIVLILATQALDDGYLVRTPSSRHISAKFPASLRPSPDSMTLVSNAPIWWTLINSSRIASYFAVAASAGVMYDWALTFGQEVELLWRQRWSLMTVLYLSLRYLGILYAV
ncbi:hypothetical protein BDR07DRAFT_1610586 [Suillus spraguei]|nr:hypothetical protein BDR07DRAFT_1611715 [Suillus spraguei]KAG2360718.1 hypothetical protein BDR07DRAFT_1610586 [Suillus spraguei]